MQHQEIEVRFLEIDKDALIARLHELGAVDEGEKMLEEVICYDKALTWQKNKKQFARVRKYGDEVRLTYKEQSDTVDGTEEVELIVSDFDTSVTLLERLGYPAYRHQQKLRHTFVLDGVTVDIDTWPRIPTYVELEGESEQALKDAAHKLGLEWVDAVTDNPRKVIEERYGIPVGTMKWFTFERFE
ncbi:MAG: class IV adenylate cyclase [Candidatus Pacebacteria bacterium]|nr:class IV adenylate cyclase [Candidatus Paceibacterota bacterium]